MSIISLHLKELTTFNQTIQINSAESPRRRTDGTDLVVSDPDAGVRRRGRCKTKPAAGGDDGLLQLRDVPADALRAQNMRYYTLIRVITR